MRGELTVLILLALALLLSLPGEAQAHALLVRSDPPSGARLPGPPERITATFSEPLDSRLSYLRVLDAQGQRVDNEDSAVAAGDQRQMTVTVRQGLPPGHYLVVWQTLSTVDGHTLKGSFPFTVLNPDGSEPPGAPAEASVISGGEPTPDGVAGRWLTFLGIVLAVGGVVYGIAVGPATERYGGTAAAAAARRHLARTALPALLLLALGSGLELLASARQAGSWEGALGTMWGERWLLRQGAWVLLAIGLLMALAPAGQSRPWGRSLGLGLALVSGLGYLLLISLSGHAAAAQGSFWAVASDFVHLLGAAVWLGMLAQAGLMLRWSGQHLAGSERTRLTAEQLQRFSAVAAGSLLLLLGAGVFNAFVHVSLPEGLVDSSYGRTLVVKLALVAALLAVTLVNALLLRPLLLRRDFSHWEAVRRWLVRLVAVEGCLALVVLAATAVLVYYPPARQLRQAEEASQPVAETAVGFEARAPAGDMTVNLSIAPNAVGTNAYLATLLPAPGQPLPEVLRVRLRFTPPDPSLGPSEAVAEPAGPSTYRAVGPFFAVPGGWEVVVDIRRRGLEDVAATFQVSVAGTPGAAAGSPFDFPLTAGDWAAVAAAGVLTLGLLLWAGVSQWPGLPSSGARAVRGLRIAATMVGVFLVAAATLGYLELTRGAAGNPIAPSAQSISRGRALYLQNCAVCHGESGRGDGPAAATLPVRPADLTAHVPFHSDEFFFYVITNGFGQVMPAFGGTLSEEDRWHIINYLRSQFGQPPTPQG